MIGITIIGSVFLENQTNHENVEILYEMLAPNIDTFVDFSDETGNYTTDIPAGIYNITYSKDTFHQIILVEQILFSNVTLPDFELLDTPATLLVPSTYSSIQYAIEEALPGDTILVAPGTYFENINFLGKSIKLYSIFETTMDSTYIDQTIIEGDNSDRVITFNSFEDSTSVISGFTIQNGKGGIGCVDSNPQILNCVITNNTANGDNNFRYGGGLYCENSSVVLMNTIIKDNFSTHNGGGVYCNFSSSPTIVNSQIINNSTSGNGGGVYCDLSDLLLEDVLLKQNSSTYQTNSYGGGGGLYFEDGNNLTILNSQIIDNSSMLNGGGLNFNESINIQISGCLIANNTAYYGGGIFSYSTDYYMHNSTISSNYADFDGGGVYCNSSSPTIVNSIVSQNSGNIGLFVNLGSMSISYSNVFNNENGNFFNCGQWVGINLTTNTNGDSCDVYNNIQLNSEFVNYLQGNFNLNLHSPCIDAGSPSSELDSDGTISDIGAYYYDQNTIIYPPDADFMTDVTEGYLPLTVAFTDLTIQGTGTIDQWHWNFGDSNNSSIQNPIHIYENPGQYTVSLEVTDVNDSTSVETKIDYITVDYCPPLAPQSVDVNINYPDAEINWSEVNITECGSPITPDGYIVLYSEEEDYYFLRFINGLEFTHLDVVQYR